jgi:hypothetical protein
LGVELLENVPIGLDLDGRLSSFVTLARLVTTISHTTTGPSNSSPTTAPLPLFPLMLLLSRKYCRMQKMQKSKKLDGNTLIGPFSIEKSVHNHRIPVLHDPGPVLAGIGSRDDTSAAVVAKV